MSILGVRSKVKDLGLDADLHPEHDKAVLGNALWVEDAMRDWAKKYPFDRWLPRYAYALEQMYERIPGDEAHRRAVKQVSYLTAYFPQTLYGKIGRAKLVAGIPTPDPSDTPAALGELERLALLDGKVLPTVPPAATPAPSPSPSPAALPAPTEPAARAERRRDAVTGARRLRAPLAQPVVAVFREPRLRHAAAQVELALRRRRDAAADALVERRVDLAVLDAEAVAHARDEPRERAAQ